MLGILRIIILLKPLFLVCESLLLKNLPALDGIPVQGTIDIVTNAPSLSECAAICAIRRKTCDAMYYDDDLSLCTLVYNQLQDTSTRKDISGTILRIKEGKNCRHQDYIYIWEMDLCLKFYYKYGQRRVWNDARTKCQIEDGDLITVESEFKDLLFMPYLSDQKDKHDVKRWWIGLSDHENEGIFKWITGQEVTYVNWFNTQPDGKSGGSFYDNVDCTICYFSQDNAPCIWMDRICNITHNFVCENTEFV